MEEEKTVVFPFGSASTVDPLRSRGGVIDQSCGQSAWSAVEVGGGKEAEFGVAFEEESVVVVEAGGGDVGPRGGSIGLPLPSALSCNQAAFAVMTTPARESAEEPPETVSVVSSKLDAKRVETVSPAGIGGVLVDGG